MPREGVNPLRPYYIPAHIGDEPLAPGPGAAGVSSNPFFNGAHHGRESSSYALLDDLRDWSSRSGSAPASSFSLLRDARQLVDDLLWRYASVLMAQPFEVAKTILQVRSAEEALAVSPTTGAGEPSVARLPQTPMRRESWRGYDEVWTRASDVVL